MHRRMCHPTIVGTYTGFESAARLISSRNEKGAKISEFNDHDVLIPGTRGNYVVEIHSVCTSCVLPEVERGTVRAVDASLRRRPRCKYTAQ